MNNTMIFKNCFEFLSYVKKYYKYENVYDQINQLYKDCFFSIIENNDVNIDIYNSSFFVVNFTMENTKKITIHGFMNIFKSKFYKKRYEIYDVCVKQQSRNQGILTKMIEILPERKYYYLQILFNNRLAYISYLRYFYKFISIGKLSYVNNVSFILGGYKSKRCSDLKKQKNTKLLDTISKKVENLHLDETFDFILLHKDEFLDFSKQTVCLNPIKKIILNDKNISKIILDRDIYSLVFSYINHFKEVISF